MSSDESRTIDLLTRKSGVLIAQTIEGFAKLLNLECDLWYHDQSLFYVRENKSTRDDYLTRSFFSPYLKMQISTSYVKTETGFVSVLYFISEHGLGHEIGARDPRNIIKLDLDKLERLIDIGMIDEVKHFILHALVATWNKEIKAAFGIEPFAV